MTNQQPLSREQEAQLDVLDNMLIEDLKSGKAAPYTPQMFNALRSYHYGGIPASILLFFPDLCHGHCYDRSLLMTLAFKDCKRVVATIESLRITTGSDEEAGHAFVETSLNGKTYVIDTSAGLMHEKEFYYKMQKPKILSVLSKQQCMESFDIKEILAGDFHKDKYILPLTMPLIEYVINHPQTPLSRFYQKPLQKELEKFKKEIKFKKICKEVEEDMLLMRTPEGQKKLDKKFKIVYDECGNIISKNGEPVGLGITRAAGIKNEDIGKPQTDSILFRQLDDYHKNHDRQIEQRAAQVVEKVAKHPGIKVHKI